jgi:hypothetical protein
MLPRKRRCLRTREDHSSGACPLHAIPGILARDDLVETGIAGHVRSGDAADTAVSGVPARGRGHWAECT